MKGIYILLGLAGSFLIGEVYSHCMISAYMSRDSRFDGYMSDTNSFEQHISRSRMDCDRQCTMRHHCMSHLFDTATNRCHLLNNVLSSSAGLTSTSGAEYYYKSKILDWSFHCPLYDGGYHAVGMVNGRCVNIRAVMETRNYFEAIEDCESTGGRLMVIDTAEKKDLAANLTGCPGSRRNLRVGGSNLKAANFSSEDAYITRYGEVITVGDLLWNWIDAGWEYYHPTTLHCLLYHYGHHHTYGCDENTWSIALMYFCEK